MYPNEKPLTYADPKDWIVACWTGKYWQIPGFNTLVDDQDLVAIDERPLIHSNPVSKTEGHGVVSIAEKKYFDDVYISNPGLDPGKGPIGRALVEVLRDQAIQMERIANILQKQSDE